MSEAFTDVFGQEHVISILSKAVEVKKTRNVLLHGETPGVGKSMIARRYARALARRDEKEGASDRPSIIEIREENMNIDFLREHTSTLEEEGNVILHDRADNMSHEYQEAVKELMEKSIHTRWIFVFSSLHKASASLRSHLDPALCLPGLPPSVIQEYLGRLDCFEFPLPETRIPKRTSAIVHDAKEVQALIRQISVRVRGDLRSAINLFRFKLYEAAGDISCIHPLEVSHAEKVGDILMACFQGEKVKAIQLTKNFADSGQTAEDFVILAYQLVARRDSGLKSVECLLLKELATLQLSITTCPSHTPLRLMGFVAHLTMVQWTGTTSARPSRESKEAALLSTLAVRSSPSKKT